MHLCLSLASKKKLFEISVESPPDNNSTPLPGSDDYPRKFVLEVKAI